MDGPKTAVENGRPRGLNDDGGRSPLAVVIVTYNSASVLPGLLDSLEAGLAPLRHRIIVVDNDSRDDSVAISAAHGMSPEIVRMGRNAGYAAAINAAGRMAPRSDLLVLNPDIRLAPGVAARLRAGLDASWTGATVPQLLDEKGRVVRSLRREPSLATAWSDAILGSGLAARLGSGEIVDDPELYRRGGTADWATGAILMIAARARRVVGEWDESFFLYSEEVDYCDRIRRAGYSVTLLPEAKAVHIGGEYHANSELSALMTANRIRYYARRHGRLATALFRLSIIVGETVRAALGPGHRAALRAAVMPRAAALACGPAGSPNR